MRTGTAWGYVVVSSGKQEDTLEHQKASLERLAAEQGWTIEEFFDDIATGKSGVRSPLVHLIAKLRGLPESLRPEWILMIRQDRISRGRIGDAQVALHEIIDLGCRIYTREAGEVKLNTAADQIISAVRSGVAEFENEVRSDKSRAMHARKKAAGEVQGLPPYGFVVVDKRLHPYEPEAAYLRELFALRARGWSYSKLSAHARVNAPAKRRKDGSIKAVRWATTTLTVVLSNPVYRSTIIDPELFDEVVRMRRGRQIFARQDAKNPWPMRGALRCVCGLAVTGRTSGKPPWRQRYYVCTDVAAHGGYPGHNANEIERQFSELLQRLELDPSLIATYKNKSIDVDALRNRRARLVREREQITKRRDRVWELVEDANIPRDEVAARLEELRSKTDRVAEAIAEIDREIVRAEAASRMWSGIHGSIATAAKYWKEAGVELRQEIAQAISALVGGLWVDPKRKGILLLPHGESVRKAETVCRETTSPYRALLALERMFSRA